ncbi:MAG: response regulator [Acidobacteriota bacterium]
MKVLYVEDDPVNVAVMTALFDMLPGIELKVAMTGDEGYAQALQDPPDLLLLDLRLPDCHGKDLLARMRQRPELAEVPATAVTADHQPDLSGSSFSDLWPKPLDVPRVMGMLSNFQRAHARSLMAA